MRGNEWAPLYLLVVLAIAAVLLVTFVKPLFRQAALSADTNTAAAKTAATSALPLLLIARFGQKTTRAGNKPSTKDLDRFDLEAPTFNAFTANQ